MPNKQSSLKDLRKSKKRRESNQRTKSQLKFLLNKVKVLIKENKNKEALEAVKTYQQALDKAAKIGILKKNNASRKKSSVMRSINKKV
ncbi:30S ribosomal protein S20 [Candidatus Uhrbacteria bacterium]|nr:30S ribosomal protein S20 [Candidatus Uhrbacteria bacterium]